MFVRRRCVRLLSSISATHAGVSLHCCLATLKTSPQSKKNIHMGGGASKSRAGKPTKERGSGGAEKKRLVLYSEHAAELPAFVEALRANAVRVVSSPYSFEAASADSLRQQVAKLAKQHGRFLSIALCPLGPNRAPGTYDEAEMEDCHWELSAQLVLKQASGTTTPPRGEASRSRVP